jgi:predicted transcriptional regulator
MSDRKIALELIERLPEDVDLREIARELEFVAGVKEGFRELEAGQGVEAEQVRGMVAAWATR